MKYRNRYDIFRDILAALREDRKLQITNLARKANLPVDRARKEIAILIENQLVTRVHEGKRIQYQITPKGITYLQIFQKLQNLFFYTS